MIEIAIVEDTQADLDRLIVCLHQFQKENPEICPACHTTAYHDAEQFLQEYSPRFDVVFMDIELPGQNGMRAAGKLRALDTQVCLVFVTNLASFAVAGYKVNALDYVMKPVQYGPFAILMKKVLQYLENVRSDDLAIQQPEGIMRLSTASILYIEVIRHNLYFHLEDGSTLQVRGTMKEMEDTLTPKHFCRINNGYLVNLRHIRSVLGNDVVVGGERLPIGRTKKKPFMDALTAYLGI